MKIICYECQAQVIGCVGRHSSSSSNTEEWFIKAKLLHHNWPISQSLLMRPTNTLWDDNYNNENKAIQSLQSVKWKFFGWSSSWWEEVDFVLSWVCVVNWEGLEKRREQKAGSQALSSMSDQYDREIGRLAESGRKAVIMTQPGRPCSESLLIYTLLSDSPNWAAHIGSGSAGPAQSTISPVCFGPSLVTTTPKTTELDRLG